MSWCTSILKHELSHRREKTSGSYGKYTPWNSHIFESLTNEPLWLQWFFRNFHSWRWGIRPEINFINKNFIWGLSLTDLPNLHKTFKQRDIYTLSHIECVSRKHARQQAISDAEHPSPPKRYRRGAEPTLVRRVTDEREVVSVTEHQTVSSPTHAFTDRGY